MPIELLVAYDVDRKPGTWLREQTARRERRIMVGLAAGFLVTGAFLAYALGRHGSVAVSLAFLAVIALARPYVDRYSDRHVRLANGAGAEEEVGETLDKLRREGWIVMHDVERPGRANIDHIASGEKGVYLVETKARRYEESDLNRVKHQAVWLHDQIGVWVTPVICLRSRCGKPFRHRQVWVVPHPHLLAWLRAQQNTPVDFEPLARFADTI